MIDPVVTDESAREDEDVEAFEAEPQSVTDQAYSDENQATIAEAMLGPVVGALVEGDQETIESYAEELHPADLADLIALLREEERVALIDLLGGRIAPDVLAELDADLTEEIVNAIDRDAVIEAVTELDTDDAAFILEDLDEDKRADILSGVSESDRIALNQAFEYEEDTAGRLMQREVFAAPAYWTVGQIIDRLRGSDDLPERFYEVFVIDPSFKPIGAVSLSTLLKTPRDETIESIMMPEIKKVSVEMDQEEVGYLFERYNLISTPVTDENGRLVGMITVDDVVEIVHEETQEDMMALAGVEADAGLNDTVLETVRSRFSWLAVNLLTAVLASVVISFFDAAITQVVALAVLMPIVASMGGNAGTQTLTVAVRSLATKDLTAANTARIVWREARVGLLNGVLFAMIMGVLAALWYNSTSGDSHGAMILGLIVGVAMVINLLAAGLAGILIPIFLQRAGQDPAVSSAVFVTTVTDLIGFAVFLGLGAMLLI